MLLTIAVWCVMYARRIPFIARSGLRPDQVTAQRLASISPPGVSNPSDNLRNLFELPVLFYTLVLYLFVTARVDSLYLSLAWAFVALRVAHSLVHCTYNIVLLRFGVYAVSALILWAMVLRAFVDHLQSVN